ncbi:hypothetical protein [Cellulosimicrobium marinum]|uniref:hypothetical protein n=1 Tax=Cellulosimicrobium marinum TaxID=1638992 RepID=UPI001E4D32C1|nr:hypothetical protein [Cellulosimicrobium marinum]MCB7137456.1 hypothetical protein [Cellulosimicrobium marinum]
MTSTTWSRTRRRAVASVAAAACGVLGAGGASAWAGDPAPWVAVTPCPAGGTFSPPLGGPADLCVPTTCEGTSADDAASDGTAIDGTAPEDTLPSRSTIRPYTTV